MYTHKMGAHAIVKLCLVVGLSTLSGCAREGARLGMQSEAKKEIAIACCDNCGKCSTACKFCSRCMSVRYCGKDCQKEHWRAGHKLQCKPKTNTSLPAPDVLITRLPESVPRAQRPVYMYVDGVLSTVFCDAPYQKVELTDEQQQFLNEIMQILNSQNIGRGDQEAALKKKAQKIFDHFKAQQANSDSASSSLTAKRKLITVVNVIKFEERPQDWDWIDQALMGVGDDQWRYIP
jgi:MYND finger